MVWWSQHLKYAFQYNTPWGTLFVSMTDRDYGVEFIGRNRMFVSNIVLMWYWQSQNFNIKQPMIGRCHHGINGCISTQRCWFISSSGVYFGRLRLYVSTKYLKVVLRVKIKQNKTGTKVQQVCSSFPRILVIKFPSKNLHVHSSKLDDAISRHLEVYILWVDKMNWFLGMFAYISGFPLRQNSFILDDSLFSNHSPTQDKSFSELLDVYSFSYGMACG